MVVRPNLGLRLRDRLGPEASQDLSTSFDEAQNDMLTIVGERFDARLLSVASDLRTEIYQGQALLRQDMARMDAEFRVALTDGLTKIRLEMSELRADVLRWSFVFWLGQFAATAALLGLMLRLAGR